ncbi:hypothetical protein ABBQ38_004737 [Trebouxia sp. C0009 RCD-2024]
MTQVLHHAVALFPKIHRIPQRLPSTERKAPKALQIVTHATGRTQAKHGVCCRSFEGQHAHVQQEGPDISHLAPSLQQQWDHVANAHLGDIVIKPKSHKEVWWTCDQCPDGHLHSWSARVFSRTGGSGCPQCSGHQVCKHNSLATKAPLVAAEWDYHANDGTPDVIVAQSNHMANWQCKVCGCKWKATPNARVSKLEAACPQCGDHAKSGQKTRHPTFAECKHPLLAEWDLERNAAQGHYPDKTRLKSNKQIFWLCATCPAGQEHSWSARPSSRTGHLKTGCPFCAGMAACACNSLQALYPDTAAEWDYSKDQGQPIDHTASSSYLAWWSRPQGASWQQTIKSRTRNATRKSARSHGANDRLDAARSP